jgi:hypothetical protein
VNRSYTLAAAIAILLCASSASAQLTYDPAGALVAGSGTGLAETRVLAPNMRFPIRDLPVYANSQQWGVQGLNGPPGNQCDARNYSMPWRDTYCETRSRTTYTTPLCPASPPAHHQGNDIRPSTCVNNRHPAVAVVDGTITVNTYSVYLMGADGTRYEYLHLASVAVRTGQRVSCGDIIGNVSNVMGATPTTIHLHFNIQQSVMVGATRLRTWVSPYMSLVDAYQRAERGEVCNPIDAGQDAGRDAPMTPATCRSATLGRSVPVGDCVQTGPETRACDPAGCSWYRCTTGGWVCTMPSMCTGMQHMNASCTSAGEGCRSSTLGRDVSHGDCVQVSYSGCGASRCGWYRCSDGAWQCADTMSCSSTRYPVASCSVDAGPICSANGGPCDQDTDCCSSYCIASACRDRTMCGTPGSSCTSGIQCCGGLSCMSSMCCVGVSGYSCHTTSDCCPGMTCASGRCQRM